MWLRPWGFASVAFIVLVLSGWSSAVHAQAAAPRVLVATVDDAITPVVANYLGDVIGRAEHGRFDALVVRLDTPGGLDTSMRAIVQRFLRADMPVIVYVSPDGARAASAGAIITFAATSRRWRPVRPSARRHRSISRAATSPASDQRCRRVR